MRRVHADDYQHARRQRVKVDEDHGRAQVQHRARASVGRSVDRGKGRAEDEERAQHVVQQASREHLQHAHLRARAEDVGRRKDTAHDEPDVAGQVRARERGVTGGITRTRIDGNAMRIQEYSSLVAGDPH